MEAAVESWQGQFTVSINCRLCCWRWMECILGKRHDIHIAKPCSYFRFGKKNASNVSMWKMLLVTWIFCSASFMAKEFYLISGETFYQSAHDNVYFNSSHWIVDLTFYLNARSFFSPNQILLIFSQKWLMGCEFN